MKNSDHVLNKWDYILVIYRYMVYRNDGLPNVRTDRAYLWHDEIPSNISYGIIERKCIDHLNRKHPRSDYMGIIDIVFN